VLFLLASYKDEIRGEKRNELEVVFLLEFTAFFFCPSPRQKEGREVVDKSIENREKMSTTKDKPTGEYREYLPDLNIPRFTTMKTQDAHEYAHAFKTKHIPPWLYALYEHWRDLYEEPFQGITTDGTSETGTRVFPYLNKCVITNIELKGMYAPIYLPYRTKVFPLKVSSRQSRICQSYSATNSAKRFPIISTLPSGEHGPIRSSCLPTRAFG
jgi:hypothetical protein